MSVSSRIFLINTIFLPQQLKPWTLIPVDSSNNATTIIILRRERIAFGLMDAFWGVRFCKNNCKMVVLHTKISPSKKPLDICNNSLHCRQEIAPAMWDNDIKEEVVSVSSRPFLINTLFLPQQLKPWTLIVVDSSSNATTIIILRRERIAFGLLDAFWGVRFCKINGQTVVLYTDISPSKSPPVICNYFLHCRQEIAPAMWDNDI